MSEQSSDEPAAELRGMEVVFSGSPAESLDYGLVLDSKAIPYQRILLDGVWTLWVAANAATAARDEFVRYAAEPARVAHARPIVEPFRGSGLGAGLYAVMLVSVAFLAGVEFLGVDWLRAGAIDAAATHRGEWWRAITALTLHLDQEHLLGNLLFGMSIGVLAGRLFGPGVAWLAILAAGAVGNYADMMVAPNFHRAVGASTAVFAALGLIAGFAWRQPHALRHRLLYRWAPLIAGASLLALLGAGGEHVDVLGHLCGFVAGLAAGSWFAYQPLDRLRPAWVQIAAGIAAVGTVVLAWAIALLKS